MTNQPNRPKDLDMSDVHADAHMMLEAELEDLDLPMLDIAVILLTVGDALELDPAAIVQGMMEGTHHDPGAQLMVDLVWEAIDSGTQLPHIARALEIYSALNS